MALPPDRSHIPTERPHRDSGALDRIPTRAFVSLMAEEGRAAAAALDRIAEPLTAFVDQLVPRLAAGGRLVYLGAGTSGRLGVLDASECPPTFRTDPGQIVGLIAGGDTALRRSSEHREDQSADAVVQLKDIGLQPGDTVLGITAGGSTPWPLGGLEYARSVGSLTALLCCAPVEGVDVDHLLCLDSGPELLTGSTRMKAGTATKLALNTITTAAFIRLGKVHGNRMVDIRATNQKLHDRAIRVLMTYDEGISRSAADELLTRCDGELKTSIVVLRTGASPEAARDVIDRAAGFLSEVVGD